MKQLLLILIPIFGLLNGCQSQPHNIPPVYTIKPAPHIKPNLTRHIPENTHKIPIQSTSTKKKQLKKHETNRMKSNQNQTRKIKDRDYSDTYMYPDDTKLAKKDPLSQTQTATYQPITMTKETCIAMITQEKFDKYTAMFGSEEASIKRCAMLQAMHR